MSVVLWVWSLPYCWRQGLSLNSELTDWLGCLANSSRDPSTCLPALCTRVTAIGDYVQLLNGCWGSDLFSFESVPGGIKCRLPFIWRGWDYALALWFDFNDYFWGFLMCPEPVPWPSLGTSCVAHIVKPKLLSLWNILFMWAPWFCPHMDLR